MSPPSTSTSINRYSNTTIVEYGNALGQANPPMIVFKRGHKNDKWLVAILLAIKNCYNSQR